MFIGALLIAAMLAAWLAFTKGPPEPIYQGKRLSVLLERYAFYWQLDENRQPDEIVAAAAVEHAGTNAIPTLLRMLNAKDSALKLKCVSIAQRQRLIKINFVPAVMRNYAGAYGFKCLGRSGQVAVSALNKIYESNISEDSKSATGEALAAVEGSAVGVINRP